MTIKDLKKISKNINSNEKKGYYRDKKGFSLHGIYKRNYIKHIKVLYIINGNIMSKYKFPKIKTIFRSKMINPYNLHLVGGWAFPNINVNKEILNRTINGLKPMGEISEWKKNENEIKKIIKILKKKGLVYRIYYSNDRIYIRFCRDGQINEIFNLKNLEIDYKNYYYKIFGKSFNGKFINKIKSKKLKDFLNTPIGNPESDDDMIIVGLILGYPIWSTVDRI